MKHDQRLLDLYLDGALDSDGRNEITDHLLGCPLCANYLANGVALRTAVQDRLRRVQPPPDLVESIRETIANAPAPRPAPVRRSLGAGLLLPAAAVLALLVIGAVLVLQVSDRQTSPAFGLTAQLAAAHVSFAHDDSLLEVTGEQATVQAWLRARAEFPSSVPVVPGYDLRGGRIVNFDGQPVTMLVYENELAQEYLSILTFAKPFGNFAGMERSGSFRVGSTGEIEVAVWSDGDLYHALVGNATQVEVTRLASAVSHET